MIFTSEQGSAADSRRLDRFRDCRFIRLFRRALALELAPTRVNVVSPGWVDTPMWDELLGKPNPPSLRTWPSACRREG